MNDRIAAMSRTVYAWCAARTATAADAEDLAQEVLLAMLRAAPNLRDEKAFYGFMWSVAANVYKAWLRKQRLPSADLPDAMADPSDPFAAVEAEEEICLLRRELSLLTRQCRQAAVDYYIRGMKVAEVAERLDVSVSMAKYLLFKARNTIREGLQMVRNYGEQSYHPRRLDLRYWGHGPNHYYGAAGSLLRQNILFACYNDMLTAEQIALAVGVGLPYMEEDLAELKEIGLLRCDGAGRYRSNIVIFTEDYNRQVAGVIAPEVRAITDLVKTCIAETESAVRALAFDGTNDAALRWQLTALLLSKAVIGEAGSKAAPELPLDKWGVPCVCWGVEQNPHAPEDPFAFGHCGCNIPGGDLVQCMDFPANGEMVHHALNKLAWVNVFLRIAKGGEIQSENDAAIAAELVRLGYVESREDGLHVHCPVMKQSQFDALLTLLNPAVQEIAEIALRIRDKEAALLAEHVPEHLRDTAGDMVYFRLFESAVSQPVALLYAAGYLSPAKAANMLPTTYVVLKE